MTHLNKAIIAMFFIAVCAGLLSSCHKTGDNTCKTDMAHLAGSYKLTAVQYKVTASAQGQDFFGTMDDCEKDDLLVLHANGTYDYNDIGLVCTPSGSGKGSW